MSVYDYSDAIEHSELWLSELDEDSEANSVYRRLKEGLPPCLTNSSSLSENKARRILREIGPSLRNLASRQLVQHLIQLDDLGRGWNHPWASALLKRFPEIEELLAGADGCGPGCLISWHENDEIQACFDEEMRCIGQEGPLELPIVLAIPLRGSVHERDHAIKEVLAYTAAMLKSLAKAAKIVEIIREIDDEHLRQHRLQPRIQAEPGPTGVREEQL